MGVSMKALMGKLNEVTRKALEGAAGAGKIQMYGMATWNCFRSAADAKDYLSLAHVVGLAEKAGGK